MYPFHGHLQKYLYYILLFPISWLEIFTEDYVLLRLHYGRASHSLSIRSDEPKHTEVVLPPLQKYITRER